MHLCRYVRAAKTHQKIKLSRTPVSGQIFVEAYFMRRRETTLIIHLFNKL